MNLRLRTAFVGAALLCLAMVVPIVFFATAVGGADVGTGTATGSSVPLQPIPAQPPGASSVPGQRWSADVKAAVETAASHGYEAGVAIVDIANGQTWSAGAGEFSTESVAKLFIAARLRVDGGWDDDVASTAWTMITQSDDDSANALYEAAGGDGVMQWVMQHYALPNLGDGPSKPGWWGLFHARPIELAKLLVDLRKDDRVWNWLGKAMAATTQVASDGFDQSFGIRQVDPTAPIKQGWSYDYSLPGEPAELNSTGFVDNGRYAVVVMVRGPHASYPHQIAAMVTAVTKVALTGRPVP